MSAGTATTPDAARSGTYGARQPSGVTPWPIVLLAGLDHTGRRYAAAQASASPMVDRTFWISVGEDLPDVYGAVPGARFEIVEHDGTFHGLLGAVEWASAQGHEPFVAGAGVDDGAPNLLVVSSMTAVWAMLCEQAQATADERHTGRPVGPRGIDTTPDLWTRANTRHGLLVAALRRHPGPVVLTARLDEVDVVDSDGQATGERRFKPAVQKTLPDACTAVVQFRGYRDPHLTGAHSPGYALDASESTAVVGPSAVTEVWDLLGVATDVLSPALVPTRQHAGYVAAGEHAERAAAVAAVQAAAEAAGVSTFDVAAEWARTHDGERIDQTSDLAGLATLCDDLRTRPEQVSP